MLLQNLCHFFLVKISEQTLWEIIFEIVLQQFIEIMFTVSRFLEK